MDKEQTINVGGTIEKLRRKQLLSQEDLADFSKKDRRTISDLERDQYKPSLVTIFNLAASLEMKPSELMKEIEEVEGNAQYFKEVAKDVQEKKAILKRNRNTHKEV